MAYENKRGIRTIREAITRWAPPSENNTDAYVSVICRAAGCGPDDPISLTQKLPQIIPIIRHENGQQPYTPDVIAAGIALATRGDSNARLAQPLPVVSAAGLGPGAA
jgi:hypothetical protein